MSLPRYVRYRDRRMRVLSYEGDGIFRVLSTSDAVLRVHRDFLVIL